MTILVSGYKKSYYYEAFARASYVFIYSLYIAFLLVLIIPLNSFARSDFQFNPSLSLSEEYDSNVNSTSSGADDYVTKAGANLNVKLDRPNAELQGGYLLNFNSYSKHPKNNVVTHDGEINVGLSRWFQKIVKGGRFSVSEVFTVTPDLLDNYGIKTTRSNIFRNSAGINLTLPVSQVLNLSSSYSNILTDYSSPLYKDNTTNTLGLGIAWSLKQDSIYSNLSASSARAGKVASNNYSLVFGLKHPFSQFTTFDANAGVGLFDPESGKNATTMNGSASLIKRFEWHVFTAGYSRSMNTTSGLSGTPTIANVYYLNINNIHSQYLTSGIGANYSANRSAKGSDVDTKSYSIHGSLNYTIRKWLTSSFSVSHFDQKSQISTISSIQRNQITFSLVVSWL